MNLKDKDVFVVLGPTRTGKGTLLAALQGVKMKFFMKKDGIVAQTQVGKEAYQKYFMAPMAEGDDNAPAENKIISH